MPVIVTGETYSFSEGKLYLYASASGTQSGSGIGFARDSTLTFAYGWSEQQASDGTWNRVLTGRRADMSIGHLLSDRATYNLANSTSAINAKFEGLINLNATASAIWNMYNGAVDSYAVTQSNENLFSCALAFHAFEWSAFG